MHKVKITDTSLRDAHQSLWATRMTTEDMIPVLEHMDNIGYHSLEVWGGATFDVCIRYLNEDPWERLKLIRKHVQKTSLQMLLRGQSLVGYTHYPDDVVERFVYKAADSGVDIFRVFDALNDIRNLETSMKAIKKTGKHAQACVVYTISPVHSVEHFVETALKLKDMGADSICIKDMAGLLSPYIAYDLVSLLKEEVSLPIQLHTHYIGGLAIAALLKATEAGVDIIDTASVPMAFGSSQPPVETIVRALQDTKHDTGLKLHELFEIASHFEKIRKTKGFERGVTRITDMKVFEHQVPGGMISNLFSQLEEQNASHRIEEVLEEIPQVRADMGYPPLVTPTSQIIGIQAVLNVLMGERYKMCPGEVKDYVRGLYGKPPRPIDPEIKKIVIGDEEVIDVRPADLIKPGYEKGKKEIAHISDSEEDILTYLLFPQVALKFFAYRDSIDQDELAQVIPQDEVNIKEKKPIKSQPIPKTKKRVSREGDEKMNFEEIKELMILLNSTDIGAIEIEREDFRLSLRKSGTEPGENNPKSPSLLTKAKTVENEIEVNENIEEVVSPMVGTFYAAPSPDSAPYVQVGDHVESGQTLCIVEAMKLMNEIKAETAGKLIEILVENAEPVEYGQPMFLIEKD
ncbi:MAG TPA: acetyl-CoA carboxylase biotin carboxyl carrier protein [Syntrophomonadaceae bacterium]|nr:acetyl-CoA carboxylase biotin carboxyl carrier protein [Syntrophomonadaceae bacterium]